jgi:hypothetical protein
MITGRNKQTQSMDESTVGNVVSVGFQRAKMGE